MLATAIPRINFEGLSLTDERTKLANAAKIKLGYHKLANAISCPGALLNTLRSLGIQPLVTSKVRKYQDSKEKTGWYSGTLNTIYAFAIASICVAVFTFSMTYHWDQVWSSTHYTINVMSVLFGVIAVITTVWHRAENWDSGNRIIHRWESVRIEHYQGNVPEFALDRAIRIKEALPTANFSVQYLVEKNERKDRPMPDPFLVVHLDTEEYFIDVWDEKEYEQRM